VTCPGAERSHRDPFSSPDQPVRRLRTIGFCGTLLSNGT
jgi:hypothetical protein